MIEKKSNKAKIDAKITLVKSVDRLKNVKFTSGKPEEIKKAEFKLSF
jgi:hypothetical protein